MRKIDLVLNIDPGNKAFESLKKINSSFEDLISFVDVTDEIMKSMSNTMTEITKRMNECVKANEKFVDNLKNLDSGSSKISEAFKTLSERIDDLTKKLEKLK